MDMPVRSARHDSWALDPGERTRMLVEALRSPACYAHPARDVEVIETHISYVILAGRFAYKIKKPLRLPFLDYSTLVRRLRQCEEEVRLNARTAPQVYLDVVPITGVIERPQIDGTGPVIEYAVRMRRFPDPARLEQRALRGELQAGDVDALAAEIARLHENARREPPLLSFGAPDLVLECALANFRTIEGLGVPEGVAASLAVLEKWTRDQHEALREAMQDRKRWGHVRECHGDLHLGNVVVLERGPVPFDCIEFDPSLRWIDVMSDLAFTLMDLHHHGYPDYAARLLSAYLERTGDYRGLPVLRFYMVYRALVRAKVEWIAKRPAGLESHVRLAAALAKEPPHGLVLMHGLSGSGKSTVAASLVESLGAIVLRSDVIRKAIHGFDPLARTHSGVGTGLYDADAGRRTYLEMASRALTVLRAGYTVIADAAFLDGAERRRFCDIAAAAGVPFAIVDCVAPEKVLRERLARRALAANDPSEACGAVLDAQISKADPFDFAERESSVTCDTTQSHAADLVAELLAFFIDTPFIGHKPCAISTSSTAMPTASALSIN